MSKYAVACLCALTAISVNTSSAHAHATVGNRTFPATLGVEDPGVSDELDTQVGRFKGADEDGGPSAWQTAYSAEYTKRMTENFGISVDGAWLDGSEASGWDNFGLGAKYVFLKNEEHEFMMSAGLEWEIGDSGSDRIGVEDFSVFVPALFFGKGMGDLPDSMEMLKPFAVTGVLGYAIPTDSSPEEMEWGFTLQYSVPYLEQHVKDFDIPAPFSNAVPVVEFAFETPVAGELKGHTLGTVNPGIIFMGEGVQFGLEAQIPINHDSGSDIGYLAQVHFYFDNLFPDTIGKPLW